MAALVITVIAVAYGTAAPQLGVAEFAPAARQAVVPPPTTAGDPAGPGAGSNQRRAPSTTTPASATTAPVTDGSGTAPTTVVTRSRRCVGDPPRQTDDPQSPACVAAIFEGGNGGATASGVTETEIRVAVDRDTAPALQIQLLFDYFNQSFEFYGRRLVPVSVAYPGGGPEAQRAVADDIASLAPFAALDKRINLRLPTPWFHITLARHKVINLTGREVPYSDELLYDFSHPYIWGLNPSVEQIWAAVADLTCTALVGRPASHAGDALRATTRRFGVLIETTEQNNPLDQRARNLISQLEACNASPEVAEVPQVSVTGRNAVERFKSAGVTSVICACAGGTQNLAAVTEAAGYEPELLLPSMVLSAESQESSLQAANIVNQARHVFGIYQASKLLPYQSRPFFGAMLSMQPGFALGDATGIANFRGLEATYRQLLMLATGIQGAGPQLTPDTFAQALMTAQAPNPGAGQAPFWQQAVGFGPGDHTFFSDFALAWWNPSATSAGVVATGRGSWCFLGGGTRFKAGQMPADADARFFDPAEPCR